MALFRRKKEPVDRGPTDSRSKRGGVHRRTQSVRIDLSELDKRAAPAPGVAPVARVDGEPVSAGAGGDAPTAEARRHAAVSRRTTRLSGRGTPIGSLLIQAGAVNQNQVNQALKIQQKQGGLLGQLLVAMGACRPEDVAEALGKQFRFTQVDLSRFKPRIEALLLLTPEKCRELKVIPFERLGQLICVAMVNVLNRRAITQIETLTKLKMKGFTCPWPQIQRAIGKCFVGKVEEGARKVDGARTSGASVGEVADQVAKEIRQAVATQRAAKQAAAPTAPEVEAEKYIKDAQALRTQGKLEEALKRLKAGAAAAPGSRKLAALLKQVTAEVEVRAEADQQRLARVAELLGGGRADREAGKFEEAIRKFEEAAKLEPENRVIARELSGAHKDLTRRRAEEVARKKAEGAAKALEEKRKTEEAERRTREVEDLMGLAKKARRAGKLEQAASRLADVLSIDPEYEEATGALSEVEGELAERERKRAEKLAVELAEAKAVEEQKKLEERRAKEEEKRKRAHVREVLREAAQDREAGRLELALRKLRGLAEEAPDRDDVNDAMNRVDEDLKKKRAVEEERRKAEEEKRRKAEEEIQRRAAAAAEIQAERQRMDVGAAAEVRAERMRLGPAATGGEKRLEAGTVTEGSLVEIQITPEDWRARIAEALATHGAEAASTDGALKRLPVAQRYARSREELKAMAEAARAAEAALEEAEEVTVGGDEAEIEAILEAIPEGELAEEELAEVAEVIAIPETRAQAEAISEEEFAELKPELEHDPVLEWLVTYAGFGRATVVPAED